MSITPYGFVSPEVRYPPEDLQQVPHKAVAVLPDDYVVYQGRPRVPQLWCNAEMLVSTEGVYYTSRPSILDVNADSFVSFLPTDDTWDDTALVWRPRVLGSASTYQFTAAGTNAPVLLTREYSIFREPFIVEALSLQAGSVLTSQFNVGADDAYGYTLSMALSVRESGPYDLIVFLDGSRLRVTPTGLQATLNGQQIDLVLPEGPTRYQPLYVVLDVRPPRSELWAGYAPSRLYRGSCSTPDKATSFTFTVTGAVDVFSLDMWGDGGPDPLEIVGRYSSALGAVA